MLCWDVYPVWLYLLGKCYLETHRCASQCSSSKRIDIANNSSLWGPLRINRLTSKNSGSTNITPKCMALLSIKKIVYKMIFERTVLFLQWRYLSPGSEDMEMQIFLLYLYVLVNCFSRYNTAMCLVPTVPDFSGGNSSSSSNWLTSSKTILPDIRCTVHHTSYIWKCNIHLIMKKF